MVDFSASRSSGRDPQTWTKFFQYDHKKSFWPIRVYILDFWQVPDLVPRCFMLGGGGKWKIEKNFFFKIHNSTPGESIFKKYMRFGKSFFPSTIWFQPRRSSSNRLEVMKEWRQSWNLWVEFSFSFLTEISMSPSHSKILYAMSLSCEPILSVSTHTMPPTCDYGGPPYSQ